ncbi:MAG: helicase, partial [Microbacteriaceae bacterium]|nr:helicase [Microbacteriaceae bacterium]
MSTAWSAESGQWTLDLIATGFVLSAGGHNETFERADLGRLAVSRWWFGRSLLVAGSPLRKFRGLSGRAARTLREAIARQRLRAGVSDYVAQAIHFRDRLDELIEQHKLAGRWIPYDAVTDVLVLRPSGENSLSASVRAALTTEENETVAFLDRDHRALIAATNENIRAAELQCRRDFFDRVEKTPLTDEQASAVITFDNRVRVIAAAGSGKTSVMVARAAYAVQRQFVAPDRILMLAFNTDAANELQERVSSRLGSLGLRCDGLQAMTFHSFGRSVIGKATGRKPSIAPWVEHGKDVQKIVEIVDELRETSSKFRYQWDVFRLLYGRVSDEPDAGEPDTYDRRTRLTGFRTYRGETVRSEGERLLADWLFLNGIEYEYERPYSHNVADRDHSQYRPDFFYPTVNVWHEHWALRADGTPPESFTGYAESMAWKKRIHQQYGTTLVESKWHEIIDLSGFDTLAKQLDSHGLELDWNPDRPIPGAAPVEHERLARLVRTFMSHVKSSSLSRDDLQTWLQQQKRSSPRTRLFLDLYWHIHDRWEQELRDAKVIDFDDMLIQAADHIERDPSLAAYDLVMVDEFQDTSRARALLTRALLQGDDKYLLAVGDDWQAINRFAGADLSAMTQFDSYFGPSETLRLQTTFRCTQTIADVASRFVSANPAQIKKTVVSANKRPGRGVSIVRVPHREALRGAIEQHLDQLCQDGPRTSLDILGRYRFQNDLVPRRTFTGLDVTFRTVHGAKGLEADHIVLPSLTTGTYGFPSQINDDPVLALAMSGEDEFLHSEERRLFYVALTRARLGVTIFTVAGIESPFVVELL